MAYNNQQEFINTIERAGELVRIKTYVDPRLEIAEITDRISKTKGGGKALLFENTGYDFPVLMNAYGSEKRMCLALGVTAPQRNRQRNRIIIQNAFGSKGKHPRQIADASEAGSVCILDA